MNITTVAMKWQEKRLQNYKNGIDIQYLYLLSNVETNN